MQDLAGVLRIRDAGKQRWLWTPQQKTAPGEGAVLGQD